MKVVDVQHLTPAIKFDPKHDCIDVVAHFENGGTRVFEVCTASYLPQYFEENEVSYLPADSCLLIVDELAIGTVTKCIEDSSFIGMRYDKLK